MYFTVELFLDPATEDAISAIRSELGDRLSLDRVSGRPHITLAACDDVHLEPGNDPFRDVMEGFAGESIVFGSLGVFSGDRFVLFLAPVVTDDLLMLHKHVHECLDGISSGLWEYYRPGQWVPHCTLVEGLSHQELVHLIDLASAFPLPMISQIAGITVRRYPPEAKPTITGDP